MLAIIIINYNTFEKTIDCIDSIRKGNFKNYKIYLLDNNSTNNSYELLKKKYEFDDDVLLIRSEINLGYAKGNNLCIEYAEKDKCKYALISNNDILYEENTIEKLYKEIKKNKYFIIAPKVILPDGQEQISIKDKKTSFFKYILYETYLNSIFKEKTNLLEKREVYWVSGCAFIINLPMFKNIGYFDPNTFLYYEEYIISEKCYKYNYKCLFDPSVTVIHYHGASTGNFNIQIKLIHLKSELYFWKKYKKGSFILIIILYLIRLKEIKFSLYKKRRIEDYKKYKKESKKILFDTQKIT